MQIHMSFYLLYYNCLTQNFLPQNRPISDFFVPFLTIRDCKQRVSPKTPLSKHLLCRSTCRDTCQCKKILDLEKCNLVYRQLCNQLIAIFSYVIGKATSQQRVSQVCKRSCKCTIHRNSLHSTSLLRCTQHLKKVLKN